MINRFIDEYAFLSNMYECEIEYNGIIYSSTENAWNDKYWGVCLKTNIGQNNLGKLLMLERDKHKEFSLFNILKVTN